MSWGLDTTAGLVAPRAADFLVEAESAIDAEFTARGLPIPDYDHDLVTGVFRDVIATLLGDLGEALQALYDAQTVNGATGIHLDDIGAIRGVERDPATASTVEVTLTGTAATVVLTGKLVQDADGNQWAATEAGTVGGADVTFEAVVAGATTLASGATLSPVTPVAGWTGGTASADATVGNDRETDAAYRLRQQAALQNQGSASANAIRARLLQLDYIEAAIVVVNNTAAVVVSGGVTLQPHSIAVIVYPATLTTAQEQEVVEVIYLHVAPGVYTNGAESATVTRADGYPETIRWAYAADLNVAVVATVVLATGYVLSDVQTAIEELIAAWFDEHVMVGQAIYDSEFEAEIMNEIEGVKRVTVTLAGGTTVTPDFDERPILNPAPATVAV